MVPFVGGFDHMHWGPSEHVQEAAMLQATSWPWHKQMGQALLKIFGGPTPFGPSGIGSRFASDFFLLLFAYFCWHPRFMVVGPPKRHGKAPLATQQDSRKPKGDASVGVFKGETRPFPSDKKGLRVWCLSILAWNKLDHDSGDVKRRPLWFRVSLSYKKRTLEYTNPRNTMPNANPIGSVYGVFTHI